MGHLSSPVYAVLDQFWGTHLGWLIYQQMLPLEGETYPVTIWQLHLPAQLVYTKQSSQLLPTVCSSSHLCNTSLWQVIWGMEECNNWLVPDSATRTGQQKIWSQKSWIPNITRIWSSNPNLGGSDWSANQPLWVWLVRLWNSWSYPLYLEKGLELISIEHPPEEGQVIFLSPQAALLQLLQRTQQLLNTCKNQPRPLCRCAAVCTETNSLSVASLALMIALQFLRCNVSFWALNTLLGTP